MKYLTLVSAALIVATAPGALARQSAVQSLPAGSVLRVKLNDSLSSKDAQAGDKFTATVEPGQDGSGLPTGTKVVGTVTSVHRATKSSPGVMDVAFRSIRLPDGVSHSMAGTLVALDSKSVYHASSGRLMAKKNASKRRLQLIGYGAGAGFVIGALTHGNALTDALLGAAGGYGASLLEKSKTRNREVSLKQGTVLGVQLNQQLALATTTARRRVLR